MLFFILQCIFIEGDSFIYLRICWIYYLVLTYCLPKLFSFFSFIFGWELVAGFPTPLSLFLVPTRSKSSRIFLKTKNLFLISRLVNQRLFEVQSQVEELQKSLQEQGSKAEDVSGNTHLNTAHAFAMVLYFPVPTDSSPCCTTFSCWASPPKRRWNGFDLPLSSFKAEGLLEWRESGRHSLHFRRGLQASAFPQPTPYSKKNGEAASPREGDELAGALWSCSSWQEK